MAGGCSDTSSSFGASQVTRSFWLQYLTVMLIIVTFVISVYSSHKIKVESARGRSVSAPPAAVLAPPAGSLTYADLFEGEDGTLNEAISGALAQLLLQHDVDVDVEIFQLNGAPGADERLARSLASSISLYRYLRSQGVPASALRM